MININVISLHNLYSLCPFNLRSYWTNVYKILHDVEALLLLLTRALQGDIVFFSERQSKE